MPVRWVIHSSDVSISWARSSLVTTRSGTWNAVAMNSVRSIAVPCEEGVTGQDFAPSPPKSKGVMDLSVTREQFDAVRGARHLPDVLKQVLDAAQRSGGGYVLHLTYEEATAL